MKLRLFAIAFAGLLSVGAGCAGTPEEAEGAAPGEELEREDDDASLAAASADLPPQVVTPPAGTGVPIFGLDGAILKLKTTWGGGYVLNMGGTEGSDAAGVRATIHWNFTSDSANRFVTYYGGIAYGHNWYRLQNMGSGKCLAAEEIGNYSLVSQVNCDPFDHRQWWADYGSIFSSTLRIRNLAHVDANLDTYLTQYHYRYVGSQIIMQPLKSDSNLEYNMQEWVAQECKVNGVEQPDC